MLKKNGTFETSCAGNVLEITLKGEIDHHSAVRIRGEMDTEIRRLAPKEVILNLSEIDFMDSSGLGLIMGRYALVQQLGGTLAVRNPNARVMKILELAGLGRVIAIERDDEGKKEMEQ